MQNGKQNIESAEGTAADLSKLFDFPSVGELFSTSDTRRFDEFCLKLKTTRESLERILRYGTRDEAEKAMRAARAVEVTLDFLQSLQQMRQNSGK